MSDIPAEDVVRLKAIASDSEAIGAGTVTMVGLDRAKAKLGNRWDDVKERVFFHADIALRKTLGENDVFIRMDNGGFILVFANPDPAYGERMAAKAADAIMQRLFGEEVTIAMRIQTRPQAFTLDQAGLSSMLADGRSMFADGDLQDADEDASNIDVMFEPVWHIAKRAVIEYVARPYDQMAYATLDKQFGSSETPVERRTACNWDVATLEAVHEEFKQASSENRRVMISACLNASTLSTFQTRVELLKTLTAIPSSFRRYLDCVIYETRIGAGAADVESAAQALGPHCRRISLATMINDKEIHRAAACGLSSVGIDLLPFRNVPERHVMQRLLSLASATKEAGLEFFVYGATTKSLSSFLTCCGAARIGGPSLGPCAPNTSAALRFEPKHLYSDLM